MMMVFSGAGFTAIGGEWFPMWPAQQRNGPQPAVSDLPDRVGRLIVTQSKPQSS